MLPATARRSLPDTRHRHRSGAGKPALLEILLGNALELILPEEPSALVDGYGVAHDRYARVACREWESGGLPGHPTDETVSQSQEVNRKSTILDARPSSARWGKVAP